LLVDAALPSCFAFTAGATVAVVTAFLSGAWVEALLVDAALPACFAFTAGATVAIVTAFLAGARIEALLVAAALPACVAFTATAAVAIVTAFLAAAWVEALLVVAALPAFCTITTTAAVAVVATLLAYALIEALAIIATTSPTGFTVTASTATAVVTAGFSGAVGVAFADAFYALRLVASEALIVVGTDSSRLDEFAIVVAFGAFLAGVIQSFVGHAGIEEQDGQEYCNTSIHFFHLHISNRRRPVGECWSPA
jgi:hypothetical protein